MLKLGEYVDKLPEDGKRRYREKTSLVGFDPFALFESQAAAITGAKRWTLPPVDGSDIVSYLVLQTSFVTAKQFKAHKSMEAYNQFVCGWVKDVQSWNAASKCIVTGKVNKPQINNALTCIHHTCRFLAMNRIKHFLTIRTSLTKMP